MLSWVMWMDLGTSSLRNFLQSDTAIASRVPWAAPAAPRFAVARAVVVSPTAAVAVLTSFAFTTGGGGGTTLGEEVGWPVGPSDGFREGLMEGKGEGCPVGASDGGAVGLIVGGVEGGKVRAVIEGEVDGGNEGARVGGVVGSNGPYVGEAVGAEVGIPVGAVVGCAVGDAVGVVVGFMINVKADVLMNFTLGTKVTYLNAVVASARENGIYPEGSPLFLLLKGWMQPGWYLCLAMALLSNTIYILLHRAAEKAIADREWAIDHPRRSKSRVSGEARADYETDSDEEEGSAKSFRGDTRSPSPTHEQYHQTGVIPHADPEP
eukprot:Hpha_TRINITY_DN15659_c3_g5::TRINITY_DN15659_c3_g5_i1::g.101355::m.101355